MTIPSTCQQVFQASGEPWQQRGIQGIRCFIHPHSRSCMNEHFAIRLIQKPYFLGRQQQGNPELYGSHPTSFRMAKALPPQYRVHME